MKDVNKETGALAASHDDTWAPDKAWTAWPLSLDRVPPTDFMPRNDDDDDEDAHIFRRPPSREGPGRELEEELSATILRFAKERFRQRRLDEKEEPERQVVRSIETTGGEESDISLPKFKAESQSGIEEADESDEDRENAASDASPETGARQRRESPLLIPTVSANDELSYEILRPMTRHLLTKLDKTLTVLHNAQVAGIDYGSDSDQDEREEKTEHKSPMKRSKQKVRLGDSGTDSAVPAKPTSRRLELHTPQDGETEWEMIVRLARKYHRRIPRTSDDEAETTTAEAGGSRTSRRQKRARVATRSMSRMSSGMSDTDVIRRRRLGYWALRDWSDVLGAAAIAGFSPSVISRATQRCADLFGQGMEVNVLAEEPATGRSKKSRTTRYVPGGDTQPIRDEDDQEEGYQSEAQQIRAVSRASSVILDGSLSEEDGSVATPRRSRRSYSVGPSVVRLYCPHPTCSGAINGFARRYNLRQHLIVVHGKNPEVVSEDEDDMDEVFGAVHVDGFLKPIRPRKGWRAGDAKESIGRKQLRGRKKTRAGTPPPRHFFSDDGYYAEVNDDDLIKNEDDQDYI